MCALMIAMQAETIEQFLKRGGRIKVIKPQDDRCASHRTRWHYGSVNNNRSQYTNNETYAATGPGGRIEPSRPYKSRSNRYKKPILRPPADKR